MMLLIVDDNPAVRRLIGRVIKDLVDDIHECEDGAAALAAYRRLHPDLVLMDIGMKEVDGITATRQIIAEFPDARVIIVTDHGDEPFRVAAREAGACGFVLKENLIDLRRLLSA